MGDFNAGPGLTDRDGLVGTPPNLAAPGKRMLSSMTPTILARDGKLFMVTGSPGGRTIINTVLETILKTASCETWIGKLEAAKVPCGPINDMASMDQEPQVAALGIIQPLPDRPVRTVHLPISIDGERMRPAGSVPAAGEHTAEIVGKG